MPTPISLSLSGFYQQLEFVDTRGSDGDRPLYIQSAAGLNFGLTFPLAGGRNSLAAPTRLGFFYSFSPTTLEDLLAPRTPLLGDLEQSGIRTATFTPLLSYDTLERNFAAQRGRRLLLAVELSGRALGGNVNTVQPRLDFTQFIPRGRLRGAPRNFGMRVHAAHIAAYGQRFMPGTLSAVDGVPIFNRFFLGGENEVRGYQFNSIGPLARVERLLLIGNNPPALSASDLRPIGGDTQVIFNAEYGLPLRRRLVAAAFLDLDASFNARRVEEQRVSSPVQLQPDGAPATLVTVLRPLDEPCLPGYRFSFGVELAPIINQPLRLIFAVNPNAQRNPADPVLLAPERSFTFRIGFGRTL